MSTFTFEKYKKLMKQIFTTNRNAEHQNEKYYSKYDVDIPLAKNIKSLHYFSFDNYNFIKCLISPSLKTNIFRKSILPIELADDNTSTNNQEESIQMITHNLLFLKSNLRSSSFSKT